MATKEHDKISMNLVFELFKALGEDAYSIFGQTPRVYISLSGKYRIPDVTVAPEDDACEWQDDLLTNPIVVIEILSPSNKGEEFLKKLQDYKSIESLQEYWLIAQDEVCIERFVRQKQGWLSTSYGADAEEITFPSLDISLKTEKVYKNVSFKK
jgi:Uma2 family endonuclease